MPVLTFSEAEQVAGPAAAVIARHPGHASVPATILELTLAGHATGESHWFLLSHGAETVGLAMFTPPWNVYLTPLPDTARADLAAELVRALMEQGLDAPGVTGVGADAEAFADLYTAATGTRARTTMRERLYEVTPAGLLDPGPVAGRARLGAEADVELTARWLRDFELEALPDNLTDDYPAAIRRRIDRGWLTLWEVDGTPVAMAGTHRPAAGVSRVGPVYTPPLERGRGYGKAVSAAATRRGFEAGAHTVVLYADLDNPVSNGVYRTIGYHEAGDALMIAFDRP